MSFELDNAGLFQSGGSSGGGGIGGIATALTGGIFGALGQSSANATQEKIASDNRDFQREMSNTAYQRATQDMTKAGINPMLAYMQGGASTPQGMGAQTGNVGSAGVSSALSAMQARQQEAATNQAEAQASKAQAEADWTPANMKADTINKLSNAAATPIFANSAKETSSKVGEIPGYNTIKDLIKQIGSVSSAKQQDNQDVPRGYGRKVNY